MRGFGVLSDLYGVSNRLGIGGALAVLLLDAAIGLALLLVAGVIAGRGPTFDLAGRWRGPAPHLSFGRKI